MLTSRDDPSSSYFLFKPHDPTSGESGRQQQLTTRLSSVQALLPEVELL